MSSSVTDGMDIRILATEARVGDLLVIANGRRIDSTIIEIVKLPVGR